MSATDIEIRLVRRHKSGLFGVVWEGRQVKLDRRVAVKVIKSSMANAANAVDHAQALARVHHPNVVTVFQVSQVCEPDSGELVDCAVMEWLDGERLEDRLNAAKFSVAEAVDICTSILDGLDAIHAQDTVHGDLHGGNVLLTSDGVKIIDIDYTKSQSLVYLSNTSRDARIVGDIEFASYLCLRILMHSDLRLTSVIPQEGELRRAQTLKSIRNVLQIVQEEDAKPVEIPGDWEVPDRMPIIDVGEYQMGGEAVQLLIEASIDPRGVIMYLRYMGGEHIQTNGKTFMKKGDPRSASLWKTAIEDLQDYRLIAHFSHSKGCDTYHVTTPGYDLAEKIRGEFEMAD